MARERGKGRSGKQQGMRGGSRHCHHQNEASSRNRKGDCCVHDVTSVKYLPVYPRIAEGTHINTLTPDLPTHPNPPTCPPPLHIPRDPDSTAHCPVARCLLLKGPRSPQSETSGNLTRIISGPSRVSSPLVTVNNVIPNRLSFACFPHCVVAAIPTYQAPETTR